MQIHGAAYVHGPQTVNAPHRAISHPAEPAGKTSGAIDQLDISREADFIGRIREIPDIRTDRVAAIRQQIADGVYETDDKLDLAIDRLLDEIG